MPEATLARAAAHCPAAQAGYFSDYDSNCFESSSTASSAAAADLERWESSAAALREAIEAIEDQLEAEEEHLAFLISNSSSVTAQEGLIVGLEKALLQMERAWWITVERIDAQFYDDMLPCCIEVLGDGGGGGSSTGGRTGDETTPPPPHIRPVGL